MLSQVEHGNSFINSRLCSAQILRICVVLQSDQSLHCSGLFVPMHGILQYVKSFDFALVGVSL